MPRSSDAWQENQRLDTAQENESLDAAERLVGQGEQIVKGAIEVRGRRPEEDEEE